MALKSAPFFLPTHKASFANSILFLNLVVQNNSHGKQKRKNYHVNI